jgi:AraC family transcriptional regulator, regulatory protein of adaptative response / methylated-DNA-[protein]-cysteine methyltransferase
MRTQRNGTAREVIRYGAGVTEVGRVLVAVTPRGLCALRLLEGTTLAAEVDDLRGKYPHAEFQEDARAVTAMLGKINAVLEGQQEASSIPLDLHGTPFQQRVWQTLLKCPRGSTWSYSQLAAKVGKPRAVRAVASACARNPVGLIVPCHRILRCDGSLGGYYWGAERKRALLQREMVEVP